jgi:hypothetical protein
MSTGLSLYLDRDGWALGARYQSLAYGGDEDSDCSLAVRAKREWASNTHPLQKTQRMGHPASGGGSEKTQGPSTAFGYASLRSG